MLRKSKEEKGILKMTFDQYKRGKKQYPDSNCSKRRKDIFVIRSEMMTGIQTNLADSRSDSFKKGQVTEG